MNALTTLVLELDLPIFAAMAFAAYSFLKAKLGTSKATQSAEILTYRQRAQAKNPSRVAA